MQEQVFHTRRGDAPDPAAPSYATGPSVAAFMAAGTSLLALGTVVLATALSKTLEEAVFDLGKLWIAQAEGIGPYSGKMTVALLAWAVAWPAFHFALRDRNPNVKAWFVAFLLMVGVAALFVWPPVWHLIAGD